MSGDMSSAYPDDERLPPVVLATLGVALLAVVLWNFRRELLTLRVTLPPVFAAAIGVGLAVGVLYGAAWLWGAGLGADGRWTVTATTYGGALLFVGVIAATVLIRLAEGRTVGEKVFVLLAAAGSGANAGLGVGYFYVRARRDAREARTTRDQFELLNSIIRHEVLNRMQVIRARARHIRENTEGQNAAFAATVVAQTDDISDQVERTRAVLAALAGDRSGVDPVALPDALDRTVDTFRTTHDDLDLTVDTPPEVDILADDLLDDVLGKVLSNAVEHNDKETVRVDVTARRHDGTVDVRVADNGPGVSDDLKEAVFRRDTTGLHEDATGSGFDLFFVDAMMDTYGGDVWIEDNDPEGAAVVLQFRCPDVES